MNKNVIACGLCPHDCHLSSGQTGFCGTRRNEAGRIISLSYGQVTSLALDPIEKKPLYHFYPRSVILSVGSFGCNMACAFCQNYSISQGRQEVVQGEFSPEKLAEFAHRAKAEAGSIGVAFTYNEPLLSYDYLLDVLPLLRSDGQKIVLVTNGQINAGPLAKLLPLVDAMNIDLKAFTEDKYKWLGGDLETTKHTITAAVAAGVHVEVTTLVVPGVNDLEEEMEAEARWLASMQADMPLHLSRYFPRYKFHAEATSLATLQALKNIARKYLQFVYLGNV